MVGVTPFPKPPLALWFASNFQMERLAKYKSRIKKMSGFLAAVCPGQAIFPLRDPFVWPGWGA